MFRKILCAILLIGCLPLTANAEQPSVSAASAVVMEAESGDVLYAKDMHTVRSLYTTTKLVTALVAAEMMPLSIEITATLSAVTVEGTALGLKAGDTISLSDLHTGLLLVWGNDAANVTAQAVAGNFTSFASLMNTKAAALGMKNSYFVTPSGLDAKEHGSTAYDMALLGRAVLQNAFLRQVCATESTRLYFGNPKREVWVTNHNRLLKLSEYCIGLKTGFTKKSGRCLVSAAEKDGVCVVVVTLNAPDDWNDHLKLYDYAFSQLERVTVTASVSETMDVAGGLADKVNVSVQPLSATIPKNTKQDIKITISLPPFLWAPVGKGQTVGSVTYTLSENRKTTVPIIAEDSVELRPALTAGQRFLENWNRILSIFFK